MRILTLFVIILSIVVCTSCSNKKNATVSETNQKSDSLLYASGKLSPEILWKFGRVGTDIQLSPDGKTILYTVKFYDLAKNTGNADLYSVSVNGGEPSKLTDGDGDENSGTWRPDGKKIGYLALDDSSTMQLWEMNPDGSGKTQVTKVEGGINGYSYSPDLKKILYIKDVKLDETPVEIYKDLPQADVKIIDNMMYRHWNSWHDYAYSHIFVSNYSDGKVEEGKDIMEKEKFDCPMNPFGGMEQITWNPDGTKIAYACKKLFGKDYTLSTNSEIYVYDLQSGTTENISEPGYDGYDFDPVFSPDGKSIAWRSMEENGFESDKDRIIIMDLTSKESTDLSADFDQSSTNFVWSADGTQLYFISGTKATFQLFSMTISSKEIKQITTGKHDYQSFVMTDDNLIGTKMSLSMPTEIYKINIQTGKEVQLSFTNKDILAKIKMGNVEERWIKTTDNKDMLTWVVYPPDFDSTKKYPAILYCQGGPQSAVSQFFSYRWNLQIMAANGYIVVAPNRRGLPTFGQEWNDQISGDYGGQNMKDYLVAIDDMAKQPFVDKDRLGAVGASYGGFSVFWLAGNHNKRFKAFISHCGMFNLESQYASTEEYFFVNKDLEGPYWDNKKSFTYSPHKFVKNWDTPILIITGENDFRIPYTESLQAFNTAQLLGVESKLLVFPGESHFILKPQNSVLWQREFFKWLDDHLKK